MNRFLAICVLSLSSYCSAQSKFEHWYSLAADGDIVKRLDWKAELNFRYDTYGLSTVFPEVGLEYKLNDWLKTTVDYRLVSSRNSARNFVNSSRVNMNLNAKKELFDRFTAALRARYQFSFAGYSTGEYDPDFDQSFRLKPKFEYDIDNFPFTPSIGTEFFLRTIRVPHEPRLSKIRSEIGMEYEGFKNQKLGMKYMLENRFGDTYFKQRHIISISYSYKF